MGDFSFTESEEVGHCVRRDRFLLQCTRMLYIHVYMYRQECGDIHLLLILLYI